MPTPKDPPKDPEVLDPDTLARLFALQRGIGAGQDVMGDLLAIFRDDAVRYLADLERAVAAQDDGAARAAIHTLKGAALSVGAARVARRCAALEQGSAGDRLAARALLGEEVEAAVTALAAVVADAARRQS